MMMRAMIMMMMVVVIGQLMVSLLPLSRSASCLTSTKVFSMFCRVSLMALSSLRSASRWAWIHTWSPVNGWMGDHHDMFIS
jgi:hypothetical protein